MRCVAVVGVGCPAATCRSFRRCFSPVCLSEPVCAACAESRSRVLENVSLFVTLPPGVRHVARAAAVWSSVLVPRHLHVCRVPSLVPNAVLPRSRDLIVTSSESGSLHDAQDVLLELGSLEFVDHVTVTHTHAIVMDWQIEVPLDLKSSYLSPSSGSFYPVDTPLSMSEFIHSGFCVGVLAKLAANMTDAAHERCYGFIDTSVPLTPVSPLIVSVKASSDEVRRFLQVVLRGTSVQPFVVVTCNAVATTEGIVTIDPRAKHVRPVLLSSARYAAFGFQVQSLPSDAASVQIELVVHFRCFDDSGHRLAVAGSNATPTHEYRTLFELPLK
jgi:hypothetical protein